mgnify:CR=1 FL=1
MRSGSVLIVAGFVLIVVGLALVVASVLGAAQVQGASYGGVLLIGPIPIVFGAGPHGLQLAMVAAAISAALMILALIFLLAATSTGDPEGGRHQEREDQARVAVHGRLPGCRLHLSP